MPIAISTNPLELFNAWYAEAQNSGLKEPTSVNLATADKTGKPSNRTVLLKGYDERGFAIYTNNQSRKGQELLSNPYASLCFYWMNLGKQIRIEGKIEPVTEAESDAYFQSRQRISQLGALASDQSRPMPHPNALKERVAELEKQYEGKPVPRPAHWHGFRVIPQLIEFWQEGPFRLHDRLIYIREGEGWKTEIWYP